jgi:hypothetical protein
VIHDVYSWSYGGWGLYNDEGSTGIVMENNLVYNTKTGGYHQHYGRENVIRNNILAFSRDHQVQITRAEEHLSFTFEQNIVYWKTGELLSGRWTEAQLEMNRNLYWNAAGKDFNFDGLSLAKWRELGYGEDSIIEDPQFVDPDNYKFRLQPGSPADKIEFEPFDYTKAGVYGNPAWVQLANNVEYPELKMPPEPRAVTMKLDIDFEEQEKLRPIPQAEYRREDQPDLIAITDETAAQGNHSLKMTDRAGLKQGYNPHFYLNPDHRSGITTCSYDLRLDKNARLHHEWRDSSSPYKVGPSLRCENGELSVQGKQVMEIPADEWFHVEITAALGEDSDGTWDLTVTVPGKNPKEFTDLKTSHDQWKKLNWLGFISNANQKTAIYIDNLNLTNKAD